MSDRDYSELEGKVIEWIGPTGIVYNGLVAYIEKDIGITIVNRDNKKQELTCYDGPSSKVWKRNKDRGVDAKYQSNYDDVFSKAIEMITNGCFDCRTTRSMYDTGNIGRNMQVCSFN